MRDDQPLRAVDDTRRAHGSDSMVAATGKHTHRKAPFRQHEQTVLVLQGGGALGAYQAGVYLNRRYAHSAQSKDYDFSRATVRELVRLTSSRPDAHNLRASRIAQGHGIRSRRACLRSCAATRRRALRK